jgi:peptidoglycan/xylan/chitin deacetylase (PgdA/CDA1 family)
VVVSRPWRGANDKGQTILVRKSSQRIPILMYHSISDRAQPRFRKYTLSPARFAEQMAYLTQQRYLTLTVSQYVAARTSGGELPEPAVVLTFDDGYTDFYTAALPVLQCYNLVATLYISTGFVNGNSRFLQRERETERPMLTWEQLNEVAVSGIECGAHGHRHLQLDVVPSAIARAEITRSKQILEENLSRTITSFAYPYGYYRPAVQRLVREAGYSSACAVRYAMSSPSDDPFALSRLMVPGGIRLPQFAELLAGRGPQLKPAYERLRALVWRYARYGLRALKQSPNGSENHDPSFA